MNEDFMAIDFDKRYPGTAHVVKDFLAFETDMRLLNTKYPVREEYLAQLPVVFNDHREAESVILEALGSVKTDRATVTSLHHSLLLSAAISVADDLSTSGPRRCNLAAGVVHRVMCTTSSSTPVHLEGIINTTPLLRVFGFMLAKATQKHLLELGTANTNRRKRMETIVSIVNQFVQSQHIAIDETNWRELFMVYNSFAID